MPEIGPRGGIAPHARLPAIPQPKAVAPAPPAHSGGFLGSIGQGITHAASTVSHAVATGPHEGIPSGSDAASSGPGYGSKQADAYKATPQYQKAVVDVFKAQPVDRQEQIIAAAKTRPSLEGSAILRFTGSIRDTNFMNSLPQPGLQEDRMQPREAKGLEEAGITPPSGAVPSLDKLPGLAAELGKNTVSDLYHLGPQTVEGAYALGKELWQGHYGNAFHMLVDPYVKLFTGNDPLGQVLAHPLNTALMFLAPERLASKTVGAGLRAAGVKAAGTAREDLRLPDVAGHKGPPIEARKFSRDPQAKALQKLRDKVRGDNANVAAPATTAPGRVLQTITRSGPTHKIRRVVDEMSAVRQMVGRTQRGYQLKAFMKNAPHKDVRDVVSHILQGVVRTPETAAKDLQKEIDRLTPIASKQVGAPSVWSARKQIASLQTALGSLDKMPEAFKAAGEVRQILHSSDNYLTRMKLLNGHQALRSRMMPYALAHMGAKYDAGLGLVHQDALTGDWVKLSNKAIQEHLEGYRTEVHPNPARQAAQRDARAAEQELRSAQTVHQTVRGEHRAAQAEHNAASAGGVGKPTPEEAARIEKVQALIDRPGTPGEKFAAQSRLAAIMAKIRGRAGDPRRLKAAEDRLRAASKALKDSHDRLRTARATVHDARRRVAREPEQIAVRVRSGPHVPDPAYVGHYASKVAPWQFYKSYKMSRGTLGKPRTGENFRTGNYDHTYAALAAQGARTAEAITKAGLHDKILSRLGINRPVSMYSPRELRQLNEISKELESTTLPPERREALAARLDELSSFTPVEAKRFADASAHDDAGNPNPRVIRYVGITRAPTSALDHVYDLQHPHELNERLDQAEIASVKRSMEDLHTRTDQTRNIKMVPEEAVNRFMDQFERASRSEKSIGRVTQQFRRTVLPYSTHWMMQIGTEAAIRGLVAGVLDPRNIMAGRQMWQELQHTAEGRAALAEMTNATFYGQHDNLSVFQNAGPIGATFHAAPGFRQIIAAHNRYADFVGHSMGKFEHSFRLMGLGKLAREQIQEFTGSYQAGIRLQGQAVADLGARLRADPRLVSKLGRQIDDIFGKYNKFSPRTRAAIQTWMPFLPWYMNAARFVLWTLPVGSPVTSGLLASLRQMINNDTAQGKSEPLSQFAEEQLARLTPFGIFAQPDVKGASPVGSLLMQDVAEPFLPEAKGALFNLIGRNAFGTGDLKDANGTSQPALSGNAVKSFFESLLESGLPGARMAREALEGTGSSAGTSTLVQPQGKGDKVGTGGTLDRLFNPLYSFEQAQQNGDTSSSSSSGSGTSDWTGGGTSGSTGGWKSGGF